MATRTISAAGGNWNSVGTWDEGATPVLGDTVVCRGDGTSGPLTINVAAACTSINFTNYSNTLTVNNTLSVSGAITLVAAMTITTTSGTPLLQALVTGTLTSNGKAWPYAMTFAGTSQTYTLADNFQVNGTLTFAGATQITINGNQLRCAGNLSVTNIVVGTTTLVLNGTTDWSSTSSIRVNTTINTAGTVTLTSNVQVFLCTFTYTAGTFNPQTFNVFLGSNTQNTTVNCGGITFYTCSHQRNTLTLLSDLNMSSSYSPGTSGGATTVDGNFNINVGGNFTNIGNSASNFVGANGCTVVMNGTGTWSNSGATLFNCNLTINTAGTVTISFASFIVGGRFRYLSGTVLTPTLLFCGFAIIESAGLIWEDLTITHVNPTINGLLEVSDTLTFSGSGATLTLSGTHGYIAANVVFTQATPVTRTITLTQGNTYTATDSLTMTSSTEVARTTLTSSHGSDRVDFVLNEGATCKVAYVDPIRIDSSDGRKIRSFDGVLTDTINWGTFTDLPTIEVIIN